MNLNTSPHIKGDPLANQVLNATSDEQAANLCHELAMKQPNKNQYFYGGTSVGRGIVGFAVLWNRKEGEEPSAFSPGWKAANALLPEVADRAHLIPQKWGGSGNAENLATTHTTFNNSTARRLFDNRIDNFKDGTSMTPKNCFVCAFAVAKYRMEKYGFANSTGQISYQMRPQPAPYEFEFGIIGDNSQYHSAMPTPEIYGDLGKDIPPWNTFSFGIQKLN